MSRSPSDSDEEPNVGGVVAPEAQSVSFCKITYSITILQNLFSKRILVIFLLLPTFKMSTTSRSNLWSLTINNPTEQDEELIALARQKGWKVEGQKEVGKEGTLHYQLMLRTPQVRFSAVKKAFPRAHIEPARNAHALSQYVTKEETRVSALPNSQEKYPSLSAFWILVCADIRQYYDNTTVYPTRLPATVRAPLNMLDWSVLNLIRCGYHVESLGANPNTRSMWKLYHVAIYERCSRPDFFMPIGTEDRQTDTASDSEDNVSLPTINGDYEETTQQESTTPSHDD